MENLIIFDLQLFAEGGAGAAAGDGGAAAGAGAEATGVTVPAAEGQKRQKRENPLADVKYGKQPEEAQGGVAAADEKAANTAEPQTEKKSFRDLIKGEYKADADAWARDLIQNRFKGDSEATAKLTALAPLLEGLGKMHNVDPTDVQKLTDIVLNNDSLYEDEAMQRGMSVEALKAVKQMERENETLKAQAKQSLQDQQMRQHFDTIARQGDEVKQIYPGFDLMTEMQNPMFARLTAPGVGVDVRTAYEVVHRNELDGAIMQFAAQKSAEQVADAVRANGSRPVESAMHGQQALSQVKSDPRSLTRRDFEEIDRRVKRGEQITF